MTRTDAAALLRRHGPLVGGLMLAGLLVAFAALLLQLAGQPGQRASATLFVSTSAEDLGGPGAGEDPSVQRANPVVALATTSAVLEPVIDALGLPLTVAQLAGRISVSPRVQSAAVHVTVSDESPTRAAAIADAVAQRLVTVAARSDAVGPGEVRLIQVERARPTTAGAPDAVPLLVGGPLVGLLAGLVVAGLREPRREPGWGRLRVS